MNAAANIFDPKHYKNVRKPLLEAETLPTWCYLSQAFYDREVERMFHKVWNFLGREDEIPNPGDYMTFDLFGEPVIVLRDREGQLRAFANTCRHRGAKMIEGKGNCRAIACPYHGWIYNLKGELTGTAGMEKTKNFDRKLYGLPQLMIDTWDGFIFVSFDPKIVPLRTYLGNFTEEMAPYGFKDYVLTRRKEYILECNWKLFLENAMEEYHTPVVHRTSIGTQSMEDVPIRGEWRGLFMTAPRTVAVLPEDIEHAFPAPTHLTGRPARGTFFLTIYPHAFMVCTQDVMWWLQQFPMGPHKTKMVVGSCFPRSTVARPDFDEKVKYYYKRWEKSLGEDNAISEAQHAGLMSSFSTPGRLSWHEPAVQDIALWVLDRVLDRPKRANGAAKARANGAASKRSSARRAPAKKRAKR
ncbi:MAG: aromatic ring-hydroxylating dioxygenase subunit alpha [Alphaproteobacteria bacterium]